MLELGVFGGSYFTDTDVSEFPKTGLKSKNKKKFDIHLTNLKLSLVYQERMD